MRRQNHSIRTLSLALVAALTCVSSHIFAQSVGEADANPVGTVLSTRGLVTAESADGAVRQLVRRSPIFEGDVVITAERARAQIRFNDNGLIGIRPDTQFVIEEHVFNGQEDGTESATYKLLRGGIQAITGQIGNRDKSRYRFETPVANITLRGTHWAATFCSTSCGDLPPGLYGGVAEGGIDVCNGGGCEGFDKDGYFYVPDANGPPVTLLDPPPVVFDDSTGRNESQEGGEPGDTGESSSVDSGRDGNSNIADAGSGDGGSADQNGDGTDNPTENTGDSISVFGANTAANPDLNPATANNDPVNPDPAGTDTESPDPVGEQQTNEFVADADGDGIPDSADPDADGDGVDNEFDPNPDTANEFTDTDGDGVADIVDPDADGNGILDDLGETPAGFVAIDSDGDGIGDTFEEDTDGDGIANSDDPDADGNGILDELGEIPAGFVAVDTDGDGIFDTFEEDTDGDGIANFEDPDADGDGILDELGEIPAGFVALDTDGDGISDTLAEDSDGDGIANSDDPDADGNGVLDELGEIPAGFVALDTDGDGIADTLLKDSDGDGIADIDDPTPIGIPDPAPETEPEDPEDPEPTVAVAFALVNDRPVSPASNDLVRSDDGSVSITQNPSDSVTAVNLDDDDICDPCLVEVDSSSSPVLNDSITYTSPEGGIAVALGRWTGTINNSENGSSFTAPDFHFLISEQIAPSLPDPDITIVTYSLESGAATSPTDGLGSVGDLDFLELDFNFSTQEIVNFDLESNFDDGRQYLAGLVEDSVSLAGVATNDIALMGTCSGGACGASESADGYTSLIFLEAGSDSAVAGSYSLNTSSNSSSIAGVYVLEQDQALPDGIGFASAVLTDGSAHSSASGYASSGLSFLGGSTNGNAVEAGSFVNFDCVANAGGECLEANIQPTILDQANEVTTADYSAIVGRWSITDQVSYEGDLFDTEQYFHFAFSEDETADVTAVNSFIVKYDLFESDGVTVRAGSSFSNPTDQDGVSGSIDHLNMEVNFLSQEITEVNIEAGNGAGAGTGGFHITASLPAAIPLAGASVHSFGLVGMVTDDDTGCSSGCLNDTASGIVNTAFLGTQASGVLGSYNLSADTLDSQLAGSFLLEAAQNSSSAPSGAVALNTTILDAGTGTELSSALAGTGKDAISVSAVANISSVGLITHDNGAGTLTENTVVHGVFNSGLTNLEQLDGDPSNGSFTCTDCFDMDLQPSPSDLSDTVKHVATNYIAYWGRWSDQQITFKPGAADENYNAADLFYAYSEDLTPDTSSGALGASTISYSRILGSNPIDQDGVSGTLGAVNMDINFGSQQITSFDMNLSTADGDWDAHLPYVDGTTIQEAVALSGAINSFAVEGLAADPTGGITAAGTSSRYDIYGDVNTALLGPNADAVLGTYNLSVIDTLGAPQDAEAIGTFLLEQD